MMTDDDGCFEGKTKAVADRRQKQQAKTAGKKKGTWDGPLKNILRRIRGVRFNLLGF